MTKSAIALIVALAWAQAVQAQQLSQPSPGGQPIVVTPNIGGNPVTTSSQYSVTSSGRQTVTTWGSESVVTSGPVSSGSVASSTQPATTGNTNPFDRNRGPILFGSSPAK
jgi:hypothetical protein